MNPPESRSGIERKILTAILWVGILPMAVAMIVSYLAARSGQSSAVQQTLLTAVQKTAEGLDLQLNAHQDRVAHLVAEPTVIEYVERATTTDTPPLTDQDKAEMLVWLDTQRRVATVPASDLALFDLEGAPLLSTGHNWETPALQQAWIEDLEGAELRGFGQLGAFYGIVVAPIRTVEDSRVIGYAAHRFNIDKLVQYALGGMPVDEDRPAPTGRYQIALNQRGEDGLKFRFWLSAAEAGPGFSVEAEPISDPSLTEILKAAPASGARAINDYKTAMLNRPSDVLLAFQRLESFDMADAFVIAFRPTSEVYSSINRGAILALTGCIVFIAILCVISYREVHNNIVRPVSLLNEGAQIIRQGDYDLKLKIGTGDEIEELASSFNKMAVALKWNMKQLEDSEEKYRSLVTSMRDGIFQTDLDGVLTFLNPAGVEILGFPSSDKAIGTSMRDLFLVPDNFKTLLDGSDHADGAQRPRLWMKRFDGPTICVEMTGSKDFDDEGNPIGIEGVFRDITKNVRLEQDARERSERIAAINQIANVINSNLEAGRLYDSLVDELHKLVTFDYAAVALLDETGSQFDVRQLWPDTEQPPGYAYALDGDGSSSAWVAREGKCLVVEDLQDGPSPFAEHFPPGIRGCLCVPLHATGRIIGTLNLGSRSSGVYTKRSIEVMEQMAPHLAVAIRNAQLLVNLQLSLEEVTRAREKLHEANEELKTLDELKTNLLSNVSHELRTPLVAVMGYTDMILNGKAGPVNNTQQEYLEISLRNIEKLVTLIENLLDFSRLHRGDERLVFDTFDLVDCARTSMDVVQPMADSRKIKLQLKADADHILVEGDKGKMGQVFNNLLSNAVKFNQNDGHVDITMNISDGTVEVAVTDDGIGIPEEAQDKVFTRFYQYDTSSTRKYGGTGIGLSIAQDIVRLHGGRITVISRPGEGSSFRFSLKIAEALRPQEVEVTREAERPSETHLLIELVTEDRALSYQIRDLLVSEGMDMIHASSSDHAIALAQKHRPDCVLIDVGANGANTMLLQTLEESSMMRELPIVLLTNDEKIYQRHRGRVASRVKRSFRKSSLLSGIHHALNKGVQVGRPIGDKVLCIDDDPEILRFMRRCLEGEGFATDQCKSGEEALKKLQSREYGLALLDIAMPGMDGWETCKRIKANPDWAGIKVYLVTAKPVDRDMSRMHDCMADGFLLKPFRSEDLVQLVRGLEIPAVAK